jgi:uncharacterized protein (DUF2249 family)
MTATAQLDVRTLPPPQRHPQVFGTFDALAPGDAFVLVNDHDPKPLLYSFQQERAGRFEWSVLEAGPERFRIEIRRRPAEGMRTVTDYLEADHRRLDAIMEDVQGRIADAAWAAAAERFAEFACGLDRHIEIEEQILFPAFEQLTGMTHGPTTVMRGEHVDIRALMTAIAAAIAAADAPRALNSIGAIGGVLGDHNLKEERILYPTADRAAGGADARDALVRRMQAF